MILSAIYEPTFSNNSHGFRPQKSCHTALSSVQKAFHGVKWVVEGDIEACFDSFDHHVLIDILRRRIRDEHFIGLMWKMLRAGYMEQWAYNDTFSGIPQGSGVSPILANIYMSEFDTFIEAYKADFKIRPQYRKFSHEYLAARWQRDKCRKRLTDNDDRKVKVRAFNHQQIQLRNQGHLQLLQAS